LIQSQDLSSSSKDASTSSGGEAESSDAKLGDGQETVVIGDGTNNHNCALVILAGFVRNNSGDGDRRSVDAGHKESAEDDLVEGGLGSASQESVQLHKELEVSIVTLGRLAVRRANVMSVEVDTYGPESSALISMLCEFQSCDMKLLRRKS